MGTSFPESRSAEAQVVVLPGYRAQPTHEVALAILLLVIVLFGLIRYRLREMPLERDEGEYAYSGQLLLQGIPPYKLAYNMKLPGIYAAYAAIMAVFGETPAGIHVGLLLVNAASIILVYFLTSHLFGRLAGVIAACSYALLSTNSSVMGFEAHATNFVVLPALAGILLAVIAAESARVFLISLSGLCSGIAFLMKQHGIYFLLFCLLYLCWRFKKQDRSALGAIRPALTFAAGAILPYAVTCILLYRAGVFRTFWFWTASYAGEYSKMGLRRAIHAFLENSSRVVLPAVLVWITAAVGLSALWWSRDASRHRFFMIGLFLLSFASICPGSYFRPHYFVLLLPVVAMLAGVAVSSATASLDESKGGRFACVPVLAFAVAFGYSVLRERQEYFFLPAQLLFHTTYADSPFEAAKAVGDYLRQHSPPSATIAVLGSEPEIYFYAHRHSSTGYIYMYSLIGHQKYLAQMQEQMLRELRDNQPEYLVYVDVWDSWGERNRATEAVTFLRSLDDFMNSQFERVGIADLGQSTQYVWGHASIAYLPRSSKVIYVLKRKTTDGAGVLF